jgi:hypothetical protein
MLGLGTEMYRGGVAEEEPFQSLRAVSFDGTDDTVFYADDDDWHGGSNNGFTISFWLKEGTYSTKSIFSKFQDSNNYWRIFFSRHAASINFELKVGGNVHAEMITDDAVTSYQGAYTHFVVSVRTDGGNAFQTGSYIMINGTSVDVTNTPDSNFAQSDFNNTGAAFWAAFSNSRMELDQLDEFAAWNNYLAPQAGFAMYNGGSPIDLSKSSGNYSGANGPDSLHAWVRGEKNFNGIDTVVDGSDALNSLGTDSAGKSVFSLGGPIIVNAG